MSHREGLVRKKTKTAELTFTQLGGLGLRGTATTAAQRARTRGFATPTFAGCAYVRVRMSPMLGSDRAGVKMVEPDLGAPGAMESPHECIASARSMRRSGISQMSATTRYRM